MKRSIFITGIAGSGKSTISRELKALGYEAYDIEDDKYRLFTFVRKDTGDPFVDYDNTDLDKVNNARWVCDKDDLQKLVENQTNDMAFYCGIANNNRDIMLLFDLSILLQATPQALYKRLMVREGTDDFGNTEAGRQNVLNMKVDFDKEMLDAGMVAVEADAEPREIVKVIIELADKL